MMLTLKDAAAQLVVSDKTVRREIADGRLFAIRGKGGKLLITGESFDQYLVLSTFQAKQAKERAERTAANRPIRRPRGPHEQYDKLLQSGAHTLNKTAFPYSGPGVYFLWDDDAVVYIGMTKNLLRRIASHVGEKQFNHYSFIRCEVAELRELELRAIMFFDPPLNRL